MNIVRVIPLSRGISKETLTYFTARRITRGMIVTIPLRKKEVNAVVIDYEDAAKHRASIRGADFNLKKIIAIKNNYFFLPSFLDAVIDYAQSYVSTAGSALFALTSKNIISQSEILPHPRIKTYAKINRAIRYEAHILQADDRERIATYKALVRESFAKKESVFFCVPEISSLNKIADVLKKGIENYTFIFHANLTKKELAKRWTNTLTANHPVLIIATGTFLGIPRDDIRTIILDKEGHSVYKLDFRPFIDIRTFAEFFAKHSGAKLIFGDVLLRPETIWKHKNGSYIPLAPLQFRVLSNTKGKIVDLSLADAAAKRHVILSDDLVKLIRQTKEHGSQIFLFAARRGLHTTTVCNDCGFLVSCPACKTPLIIHYAEDKNSFSNKLTKRIFLCHKCGYETPVTDRCEVCLGWKLAALGTGSDRVYEETRLIVGEHALFQIDKDTTTPKQAERLALRFLDTPGGILVGTEMALPYITEKISNVAVVSADSLFAIPDFRINERVFRLLLKLRAKAGNTFLIQTRQIKKDLWKEAADGDLLSFYRAEIKERRALIYPPFSLFIKISYSGTRQKTEEKKMYIEKFLLEYNPVSFQAFSSHASGIFEMRTVIKISPETWPNKKLISILKNFSPDFSINVGPNHLL